VIDQQ